MRVLLGLVPFGLFVVVSLGMLGCSSVPEVELPGGEYSAARSLYQIKCLKCHKHYDPARYDAGTWRLWMEKMAAKANLQPDEYRVLDEYLNLLRRPVPASALSSNASPAAAGQIQ